jgi:aquaporin Z
LLFAGKGAIIVNDLYEVMITHVGIALIFGLIVMAMIYGVGDISGVHLNPVVTLGFWLAKRLPGKEIPGYVISKIIGGIAASLVLKVSFPSHPHLGYTLPFFL